MGRTVPWIFASALLLGGCGSVTVERHVPAVGIESPRRIFVIERIGPANHDIPVNFAAALRMNLASCRVEAEIVHRAGLEFDDDASARAQMRAAKPDAILDIRLARAVSAMSYEGVFMFTLSSATTGRELWKASVRIIAGGNTGINSSVGTRLGAEIVKLMADDGVLTSCPARSA